MDSFAAYNKLADFDMYSKDWLNACVEVTKPVMEEILEALKPYGLTEDDIENLPRPDGVAIKVKNVAGDIACNYCTEFEYEVLDADDDCHRCNNAVEAVKILLGRPAPRKKEPVPEPKPVEEPKPVVKQEPVVPVAKPKEMKAPETVAAVKQLSSGFSSMKESDAKVCVNTHHQPSGGMKTITKYTIVTKSAEKIAVFSSEFTRKLDSLGVPNPQIKICSDVPKGRKDETEVLEAEVKSALTHWCSIGFTWEGATYKPFMAGASDARKATATWLREELLPVMGKWALCGLETKSMKLAINKYMAYLGLLSSASKPFAEAFGKAINIRRVCVVPDGFVTVDSVVDLVDGDVKHSVDRSCEINAFDGFGIIRRNLTGGESCTLRGPWLKAFVQAVDFKQVANFAYHNGLKPEFKDFWGNTVALKDVDVILTESCFKAAKLYESWTQYQDAFERMGHTICVCVREHAPRLKGMPYQQAQTLMGNEDDALRFMAHAKRTVYKYRDPKEAARLLRADHRVAARMYPALLNEPHTRKSIQEKYASKRMDMLGGRIPELGYNAFLAPDLVAFVEHLFGLDIKGFLEPGQCCCIPAQEGPVDVTRNPHLDNAHCVLINRLDLPLAEGPTMFINVKDMTTIRLRADYDGDHVWYSQDKHLLDLVSRTFDQLKTIPIDWDVGKAEKVAITKSAVCEFITNLLHGSEIGIYADTMTKMWNSQYNRDTCDWLTYAGNVLIDAAKHAAVKITKPEDVQALNAVPLPNFARYAKADSEHPADSPYWDEIRKYTGTPRCAYSGSFEDMYSKAVEENVPEELIVDDIADDIFDPTMLMIKPDRKQISGLFKKGKFNMETGSYEDTGLFNQIAFRHANEWNNLMNTPSAQMHRDEWEYECKHAALQEIVYYVRNLYAGDERMARVSDDAILDAAYDSICRFVFTAKMTDGMETVIKQCFWRIFGDRAVKALEKNGCRTHEDDFDVDFDDDDELFDVD